ncbi:MULTISPECIES: hypothetical protein [unclassified Chryseobacterium]|nr:MULTISPECIES: hypothetical protein [unclassified Chryseobacterium]
MKTIILLAICAVSLTACRCDLPEDEDKKKSETRPVNDSLKIK